MHDIDSTWASATVLTRDALPADTLEYPGFLADNDAGFVLDGDFNSDGQRDRAAVGVYRSAAGAVGRFLVVVTASGNKWQKAFLEAAPGDPGFSVLTYDPRQGLRWWFCMQCDSWAELGWADGQYAFKEDASTDP